MPWPRQLVAGLSSQRPRFTPVLVDVGFVVDKVALGASFSSRTSLFTLSVSFQHGYILICHMEDEQ
jgi:hypothetical protein